MSFIEWVIVAELIVIYMIGVGETDSLVWPITLVWLWFKWYVLRIRPDWAKR